MPKDQAQRKADERARKRAAGLKRYEFWLNPAQKKAVDELLQRKEK